MKTTFSFFSDEPGSWILRPNPELKIFITNEQISAFRCKTLLAWIC